MNRMAIHTCASPAIAGRRHRRYTHDAAVAPPATNTHALAMFSNGIRNVPSTAAAAKSSELKPDPNFATFTKIFVSPRSTTIPVTPLGSAHLETFTSFLAKWQAGKVKDLKAGLAEVDKQIDAKLKQSGGGVP